LSEQPDFSLVLGGPLFQLLRRAHLTGNTLELLQRRMIVISSFAWVPLLVLSVVGGRPWAALSNCRSCSTWKCMRASWSRSPADRC
jgi:hypothetical protein